MLADKHTRNACLLSDPSNHTARGVPGQNALARTPLWSTMMKVFPSRNGPQDPKKGNRNDSGQLALSPQASICPPPLLGHHPMVTSLLNRSEVIIRPMSYGNGERTFKLGPIVTMSCHPWDSNAKNKTHGIPPTRITHSMSASQANPAETHSWPKWHPMNPPNTMGHLFLARVNPPNHLRTLQLMSQNQRWLQHNPWRNHLVGPNFTFLTLLNFSSPLLRPSPVCPATPRLIIIIDDTPIGSPTPPPSPDLPPIAAENPTASSPLVPSSSHSYNDAFQKFTNLQPTLMIP
ncbi:hypothetical protein O181_072845 [Austropuccinia psidii MF-1]|uniref:Uncharacterized protein n=1 Tax=Austropuccinia psidii MF-1 TaxID=1389203 RepID=A0A9Q3F1B6_9BASI|nr:hypothetical protein [Austropuccinia psidii MF-1]